MGSVATDVAILRGGGRHGAVVYEQIKDSHSEVLVWDDSDNVHTLLADLPRFASTSDLPYGVTTVYCYVAVGSGKIRQKLADSVKKVFENVDCRLEFPNVIHESAVVSATASLGVGCFVGPFALINTNATIGDFCIVNSSALVEHDCVLEDYVTINPGSILLGSVRVAGFVTAGANSTIRDDRSVAADATIGMGAAVVRDINGPLHGFWGGLPARPVFQPTVPVNSKTIRWCVKKPFSSQRLLQYLQTSLEKGHLTNDGPLQPVITAKLKAMVRSNRHPLMTCNGTAALHAIVAGIALKEGKDLRWVTQAFTFPSSIEGPLCQATVCDIDLELKGPSMAFLESSKDSFDGVIVTNVFGLQVDITRYEKWCERNGKFLVFDNAASPLGFIEDGRCIHDVGDAAFVSLHETKPFGRGEGGAIFVGRELSPFVHRAMNFGYDIPNQVRVPSRLSSNWRMSDIAAAAICDHFDTMSSNKWERSHQELLRFAVEQLERAGLQLAFPVRYPTILSCLFIKVECGSNMEAICRRLNSHGVEAKHYYCPLVSREEAPEAWKLFDSTVCLPFHLDLTREKVQFMIGLLSPETKSAANE